jgi:hypothetical protein
MGEQQHRAFGWKGNRPPAAVGPPAGVDHKRWWTLDRAGNQLDEAIAALRAAAGALASAGHGSSGTVTAQEVEKFRADCQGLRDHVEGMKREGVSCR